MKFKALTNFKSSEFAGSQYVKDGIYTIREGNTKLADMAQKWLEAKRFIPNQDFTVLGISFKSGVESYVLPGDDLEIIIDAKVAAGQAEYTTVGLITFDVEITGGTVSGTAAKQINGGQ
jgi:hypothetical protein